MLKLKIRPIEGWPGDATRSRKHSPFRSGYKDTLDLLERELNMLHARNVVVQLAVRESEIAIDGNLKAYAKPEYPGVILAFEWWKPTGKSNERGQALGKYTPLSFPCDQYTDWKDNLRAIALAMEALRKVDRYGVTRSGEQYKGWTPLPASGGLQSDEEAARTLARFGNSDATPDMLLKDANFAKQIYRAACRLTHPDTNEGKGEGFNQVQIAWERIRMRHGL
ncbi:MAG: molecular chaperone DnaJ [Blastocatellia bacterium]